MDDSNCLRVPCYLSVHSARATRTSYPCTPVSDMLSGKKTHAKNVTMDRNMYGNLRNIRLYYDPLRIASQVTVCTSNNTPLSINKSLYKKL